MNDIDLLFILKNICPGQTLRSLKKFIQDQSRKTCSKKSKLNDTPLYETCAQIINEFGQNVFDRNNKARKKRTEEILNIYIELIKT